MMAGGGSGHRGGEGLRTKMKEADPPGPGNRLDGGLRAEWRGESSTVFWSLAGMLVCVQRPFPRMEGTGLGEER